MPKLIFECYVQPNAKACAYIGNYNGMAKIKIAAQAQDGKANAMLINFIATEFKVTKKHINLIKGKLSRHKTLVIDGNYTAPTWLKI